MFWNLCLQQVRRTIISSRFLISLLLVIGFSLPELLGLRAMANHFHETIHLGFFVFFLSNSFRIMVLFVALALLFAPLPDRSEQQMQLILRTGKRIWLLAYLVAIVISLLVFLLCYLLFLEVMLVGHLRFDSRWGKILGSLGQQPQFGLPFELTLKYDYSVTIEPLDRHLATITGPSANHKSLRLGGLSTQSYPRSFRDLLRLYLNQCATTRGIYSRI